MRKYVVLGLIGVVAIGCEKLGTSGAPDNPTFANDIAPIVEARCQKCHIDESKGKFSLMDLASTLAGGKSGAVVVPGNATDSRMYKLVAGLDPEKKMPPKGDPLTADQIATIKNWIDAGAK